MKQSFLVGMACGALIALGGVVLGQTLPRLQPAPGTLSAGHALNATPGGDSHGSVVSPALDFLVPVASAAPRNSGGSNPGGDRGGLVATYGVGGVLTRDGELWQYRPDRSRWLTLDESFGLEGKPTKLVPLPVPATDVKMMETFGFLVTQKDECWLYDLDKNAWSNIGAPPFHEQGR